MPWSSRSRFYTKSSSGGYRSFSTSPAVVAFRLLEYFSNRFASQNIYKLSEWLFLLSQCSECIVRELSRLLIGSRRKSMRNLLRCTFLFVGLVLLAGSAVRSAAQAAKSEPSPFSSQARP